MLNNEANRTLLQSTLGMYFTEFCFVLKVAWNLADD